MSEEGLIPSTINAITELSKAVPIYQDIAQPAAKEIGKSLLTTVKLVNVALGPVRGFIWGYEKIEDFINKTVASKLEGIPEERIQTPDLMIAGPTIEALRYSGSKEELRELYANLLANAMCIDTANGTHPGFVDIIKNLLPDEAKIINLLSDDRKYPIISAKGDTPDGGYLYIAQNISLLGQDASCLVPANAPVYICNLERLGIVRLPPGGFLTNDKLYEPILQHPEVQELKRMVEGNPKKFTGFSPEKKYIELTEFGAAFAKVCTIPPKPQVKDLAKG